MTEALSTTDLEAIRIAMEAELTTHGDRVDRISDHLRAPVQKDWEEAAQERENDEVLEHLSDEGRRRVALLRAALRRMHDGSYGRCVSCDAAIAAARLRAVPETPWCVDCASERER